MEGKKSKRTRDGGEEEQENKRWRGKRTREQLTRWNGRNRNKGRIVAKASDGQRYPWP